MMYIGPEKAGLEIMHHGRAKGPGIKSLGSALIEEGRRIWGTFIHQ